MVIRTIISLVSAIFYVFELLILARCIFSFLPVYNKLTDWVYKATEPVLAPCRKLLDKFITIDLPLDFSPILALLIMQVVQRLILNILIGFLI